MDSSKSDIDANISLLYNQANQAYHREDKRACALLIHKILSLEITHTGAWQLLYTMLGGNQSFNAFQQAFAQKYYPTQAHQLTPPIAPSTTSYINDGIQAVAPYPAGTQNEILFCPRCGHEQTAGSLFCNHCGLHYESGDGSTAYRLGAPLREQWTTILFASLIYASATFIIDYVGSILLSTERAFIFSILIHLLPFPLLILILNKFRLNRHFFLAFLNPNAIPLISFYFFIHKVFPSGVMQIISWLMTFSGAILWMFIAFLFDLPELKLKRGLIWAGFYILCFAAGELLLAVSLPSSLSIFAWVGISFFMGTGLGIGYLLYPFAYQSKTK